VDRAFELVRRAARKLGGLSVGGRRRLGFRFLVPCIGAGTNKTSEGIGGCG